VRILVVAIGSTGDVAPYLGLGQQLTRRGFDVTVATHRSFQPMVEDAGLGYAFVPTEPREWVSDEIGERLRRGPRSAAAALADTFGPSASAIADAVDSACDGADHVLLSAMAWTGVHSADARGLPSAGVHLQPLEPTAAFAPPVAGVRSLGAILNRALGRRGQTMMVAPYMEAANAVRAKHGLPAITARQHLSNLRDRDWPVWHGFSDAVVPRPRDWRPALKVVGYWWPPAPRGWAPDHGLVDFLEAGPRPIYVGFGSTLPAPADVMQELLREISRRLGVRIVVQAGWLGLEIDDEMIRTVGEIPHAWLFPRVRAAVHHAGAGTSAAALRAGIPSVPIPVALDQPFWAGRLHRLGAATRPVPANRLTADHLTRAVHRVLDDGSVARGAARLGDRIARDRGGDAVAELLAAPVLRRGTT
jgi:UDP:flavonoid glycosyltransferase YjiC (YdhE family)